MKPTILYVCHNHPGVRSGGAEVYAHELFRSVREAGDFNALFLAKGGPPISEAPRPYVGTCIGPADDDPGQFFFYTNDYHELYDWTFGSFREGKEILTKHFRGFLRAVRPDIVHFQHTLFFGYDVLRVTRDTLPDVPIVYTLHEFLPICRNNGQLLRTTDNTLCVEESPRQCHACFPEISPQTFFLRKRFVQSHLSLVDRFIAPSRYLAERYVEWGLPRERILCEEYGRTPPPPAGESTPREPPNRVGFFGQLSHYKGVNVLLEAMALLAGSGHQADERTQELLRSAHAWIWGTNLDLQPDEFRSRFADLLARAGAAVTFGGGYDHARVGELMAGVDWVVVPSIWPENSPLVIQEAFHYGRPVICSDIGGMAEKVIDGRNGLHFRAGDARSLAGVLRRAMTTPGLFRKLQSGIAPVHRMDEHVAVLTRSYRELLAAGTREHARAI